MPAKPDHGEEMTSELHFTGFYTQTSPEESFRVRDANDKKLEASELFSLFTADIIKKEVLFTR